MRMLKSRLSSRSGRRRSSRVASRVRARACRRSGTAASRRSASCARASCSLSRQRSAARSARSLLSSRRSSCSSPSPSRAPRLSRVSHLRRRRRPSCRTHPSGSTASWIGSSGGSRASLARGKRAGERGHPAPDVPRGGPATWQPTERDVGPRGMWLRRADAIDAPWAPAQHFDICVGAGDGCPAVVRVASEGDVSLGVGGGRSATARVSIELERQSTHTHPQSPTTDCHICARRVLPCLRFRDELCASWLICTLGRMGRVLRDGTCRIT
mmetsp:Transcript_62847/g.167090  ORF Transcript_62847/g.167090 Transcript_62847/m.167090 type:complete len:270 (+) Transcript_62847:353-1162(+)